MICCTQIFEWTGNVFAQQRLQMKPRSWHRCEEVMRNYCGLWSVTLVPRSMLPVCSRKVGAPPIRDVRSRVEHNKQKNMALFHGMTCQTATVLCGCSVRLVKPSAICGHKVVICVIMTWKRPLRDLRRVNCLYSPPVDCCDPKKAGQDSSALPS